MESHLSGRGNRNDNSGGSGLKANISVRLRMDKQIKVLHVADKLGVSGSTVDGVARLLGWWFPLLGERGIDPKLLVLGPSGKVVEELQEDGISVRCLSMKPFDVRAFFEFKRSIEETQPDILHVHNWRATTFALLLKTSSSVPVIVHEHTISQKIPFVQQVADRALNHRVDRVLAVSDGAARNCVSARHFPKDRIETVMNGIPLDLDSPQPEEHIRAIQSELGIEPGSNIVGFVGRLDETKGPRYLVEAFAQLGRLPRETYLVIVGDGPLAGELKEIARSAGIADRTMFLGYRRDVKRLQRVFSVQAMPSLSEGLGLAALEAMASSVPLVASDIPGLDEILQDDVNSILVPSRDPCALAKALERALTEPEICRRLAVAAREAVDSYEIGRNVDDIVRVYRKVLSDIRS